MKIKSNNIIRHLILLVLFFVFVSACQKIEEKKLENKEIEKSTLKGMVKVPAGEFTMGSNEVDTEMLQQRFGLDDIPYQDEHPERKVYLDDYYIDIYEVTNGQYKAFLNEAKKIVPKISYLHMAPPHWKDDNYVEGEDRLPVVGVNWHNAKAYCAWSGKRLPFETEWEKAARGADGRKFPWGNEFDEKKSNSMGLSGGIAPVGEYKGDVSPYGVYDMAGNVCEWVEDWYKSYPGNEFQSDKFGENLKVVRGWYWGGVGHYIMEIFYRSSSRAYMRPDEMLEEVGFRCAWS